ncbi:MAG: hypothetical protein K9J06_01500 [Flavobacteriales bacterium]|nr:hypothetical protein [Flavobacteriales bacterium]
MDSRLWKYPLIVLVAAVVAANVLLAAYGMFSILSTIILYGALLMAALGTLTLLVHERERRLGLTLMMVSVVVCLFAAELVLRYGLKHHQSYNERSGGFFYTSPYPRWSMQNFLNKHFTDRGLYERLVKWPDRIVDYRTSEYAYSYQYNSLGMKGPEPDCSKEDRVIVGLGASFTEGIGAPEDSCWLALLAQQISVPTVYVNGGISGRDLFDGLIILEKTMQQCTPDMVILAINATSISDVIVHGGSERFAGGADLRGRSAPWFDPLYGASFIFRAFAHGVLGLNHFLMTDAAWRKEEARALSLIEQCIREQYVPLAKQHGFVIAVVLHPLSNELKTDAFALKALATGLQDVDHLETIDLFSIMHNDKANGLLDPDTLFWPLDGHHNSKGNMYWADVLQQSLSTAGNAQD